MTAAGEQELEKRAAELHCRSLAVEQELEESARRRAALRALETLGGAEQAGAAAV